MKADDPVSIETLQKDLLIAQELNFAKVLSGNDKTLRDRAIKKLRRWLTICSNGKCGFSDEDFQRIWTGLFYCMWMSDKFLVQEEVAEKISSLVHCFRNSDEIALRFIKCFNKTMVTEWDGLDQHRLDKFNMLIRRFLRQSLEYCYRKDWDVSLVKGLLKIFGEVVFTRNCPNGYLLHFMDIFPEELAKVGRGQLKSKTVLLFLEPFIKLAASTKDARLHKGVSQLFDHLIRQTNVGLEYEEKFTAWKQQGFPCRRPQDMKRVVESDEEDFAEDDDAPQGTVEASALDPRAGNVDAVLPHVPVNIHGVLLLLSKYQSSREATSSGRHFMKSMKVKFSKVKRGIMPEDIVKPVILCENVKKKENTLKSARRLMEFTDGLKLDDSDDLDLDDIDSDEDVENILAGRRRGAKRGKGDKSRKRKMNGDVFTESEGNPGGKKAKVQPEKSAGKKQNGCAKPSVGVKKPKEEPNSTAKRPKKALTEGGKSKPRKNKNVKDAKPAPSVEAKSPKFKVEDVRNGSNALVVTPGGTRRTLNPWYVEEIKADSEEYNKITVPKIVKLEKKGRGAANGVVAPETKEPEGVSADKSVPTVQLTPTFWERAKAKVDKNKKKSNNVFLNPFFPSEDQPRNSKRISFALERNEAQENEEYLEEVKNSPRIPFDGTKKPVQSALKSGLSPSPINPFYRFKKK